MYNTLYMINTYFYIVDDLLFFFMGFSLLYLFVLAVASHFKSVSYPKSQKTYNCVILVSEKSELPVLYKEEPLEFITYNDLAEGVKSLDKSHWQLVVLVSETAVSLSPNFLEYLYNAYEAGLKAIQLHTITNDRKGLRKRYSAQLEEINNSLFRAGNTQLGFSSSLSGTNMAFDLKWLQSNLKTSKTNLERRLFRQNEYIEYLPEVIVYCKSTPTYPYRKRIRKNSSYLLPSLLNREWNLFNRIIQILIPSPFKLCLFASFWTILLTAYDWSLSLKWWILLFGLAITFSLAIPNYLVKDKKKYSIWRKKH